MTKKLLLLITVLAFIVRIFNSNYPPLLWDEASLGYNAYSILKTGHDEYGTFLPLVFKSFGDFKPGLYVYLCLPFVAIFGLNPLSVRLPSIILGSLLPLIIYLLITKLSPKSGKIALITAALIAINPWNIHFSRGAWETNILLFELAAASLLFLNKYYFPSALLFGASLYTYQGGKLYAPLFILFLLSVTKLKLLTKKNIAQFLIPLIVIIIPLIIGLLTANTGNRLSVFALWNYHRPDVEKEIIKNETNDINFSLFHNEPIYFLRNFSERYFNHYSSRFLMFEGDWQIGRHSAPYTGVLLIPTFIFFIIGVFASLTGEFSRLKLFFLLWLITAPLPSALTRDIIQPVRSLPLSIPLLFFAAIGIYTVSNTFSHKFLNKVITFSITAIYILSFVYYSDLYLNHMVKVKPDHSLHGYKEAAQYVIEKGANKSVTFTDFYGQPHIYYLFWSKYNPVNFQKQALLKSSSIDVGRIEKIDNITFKGPDFASLSKIPNQLIIMSYDEVLRQGIDPKILTPLSPINGHSSFYAYETQ